MPEKGIKLNADKVQFRQKEVPYMGHSADANKLWAINDMPAPTDKQGVQRLLSIANYLQKFAPVERASQEGKRICLGAESPRKVT